MSQRTPELNGAGKLKRTVRVQESNSLINFAVGNLGLLMAEFESAEYPNSIILSVNNQQTEVTIKRTTVDKTQVPPVRVETTGKVIYPLGSIDIREYRAVGNKALALNNWAQNTPEAVERTRLLLTPQVLSE